MAESSPASGNGVQPTVEPAVGRLKDRLIKDFEQGMGYQEAAKKENCSWQYSYAVWRRLKGGQSEKAATKEPTEVEEAPEKEETAEVEIEEPKEVEKLEKPRPPSEKALAKRQEIMKNMLLSTNVLWKHMEADELTEAEADSVAAVWAPYVDPRQLGIIWASAFTALVFAPRAVQSGVFMVKKVTGKNKKAEAEGKENVKSEGGKEEEEKKE